MPRKNVHVVIAINLLHLSDAVLEMRILSTIDEAMFVENVGYFGVSKVDRYGSREHRVGYLLRHISRLSHVLKGHNKLVVLIFLDSAIVVSLPKSVISPCRELVLYTKLVLFRTGRSLAYPESVNLLVLR